LKKRLKKSKLSPFGLAQGLALQIKMGLIQSAAREQSQK
jgi:hypothetical protein